MVDKELFVISKIWNKPRLNNQKRQSIKFQIPKISDAAHDCELQPYISLKILQMPFLEVYACYKCPFWLEDA